MDLSHAQLVGAVFAAIVASALPAYTAAKKTAAEVTKQIGTNGNQDDHRTLRQMIADLMHQVTALDDRLRLHDDRQQENARRIGHIEKLVEHKSKQP